MMMMMMMTRKRMVKTSKVYERLAQVVVVDIGRRPLGTEFDTNATKWETVRRLACTANVGAGSLETENLAHHHPHPDDGHTCCTWLVPFLRQGITVTLAV